MFSDESWIFLVLKWCFVFNTLRYGTTIPFGIWSLIDGTGALFGQNMLSDRDLLLCPLVEWNSICAGSGVNVSFDE